ncbi:unnamed protein product [Adineta steineri]|uniref:LRAT domain-containing protein n=1 Tax=Adineta steineri TaxID=433720 RepID=A0A819AQG0_9BILA|nr:unnamed protein product [Adineta steineri]
MMNSTMKVENFEKNEDVISKAQAGDLLEFTRSNREVIHRSEAKDGISKSLICKSNIKDVSLYDGDFQINNSLDDKQKPLPIETILERAKNALGEREYGLLDKNCEHFATECRYGQPTSCQVENAAYNCDIVIIITISAITIFGIGFVIYKSSGSSHDKKENKMKKIRKKS